MRIIEVRGKSDIRIIALGLAHGLGLTRKCIVITDDVAFTRVGERLSNRVYKCDQVYAAIIPELFAAENEEQVNNLIKLGAVAIEEITGERAEDIVLCWDGDINVEFDVKAYIQLFKTGMKTTDQAEYEWKKEQSVTSDSGILNYMVFYDKDKFKKAQFEVIEKVLATDSEGSAIRQMEQSNKFKMTTGGYFSIANDIAVKRCGVFEGAMKEFRDAKR